VHSDRVSGPELLELAAEFQHIVDVAADEILEDLIAVETAAALADLEEPRPDSRTWGQNPDGVRVRPRRRLYDFVAWERLLNFSVVAVSLRKQLVKKRPERQVERDQDSADDSVEILAHCRAPPRHRRQSPTAL